MAVDRSNSKESLSEIPKDTFGIDLASGRPGNKDDHKKNAILPDIGGTPVARDKASTAKYAEGKNIKNGTGQEALKTLVSKHVPLADMPTTASAAPGLDLAKQIAEVDPLGKAQVFANMVKQFAMIKAIMNVANASPPGAPLSSTQSAVVTDAFSEALCILCKKYTYAVVVKVLDKVFDNNAFLLVRPIYQDTVRGAISKLIEKAMIFGENNIPVKPSPPVVYGSSVPNSTLLLSNHDAVPMLAIKQYYSADTDPYTGFIEYITNEQQKKVYVRRTVTDHPYESVDNECLALAEKGIAADLEIYFKYPEYYFVTQTFDVTSFILTPIILSSILEKHKVLHENNGMDLAVGKSSSKSLMSMLPQILGLLGTAINLTKSDFLSKSGLDAGAMGKSLESYSKNMAMITMMSQKAKIAFNPPMGLPIPALGSLAGVSSLAGALGGLGISIPSLIPSLGGISAVTDLISSSGAVGGLTSALGALNDVNIGLQAAGISIPAIAVNSMGLTPARSNISNALRVAGTAEIAVVATSNLLKNMGV
jgi:hypothetical protein